MSPWPIEPACDPAVYRRAARRLAAPYPGWPACDASDAPDGPRATRATVWRLQQHLAARDCLVHRYAFAVPDAVAVQALVQFARLPGDDRVGRGIVEIGAGSGYWARLLADRGADVLAYDNRSWRTFGLWGCDARPWSARWFPVQRGDHRQAAVHAGRVLFLCWPPPAHDRFGGGDAAMRALAGYLDAGGRRVAYLGFEGDDALLSGDADFHRLLGHGRCRQRVPVYGTSAFPGQQGPCTPLRLMQF